MYCSLLQFNVDFEWQINVRKQYLLHISFFSKWFKIWGCDQNYVEPCNTYIHNLTCERSNNFQGNNSMAVFNKLFKKIKSHSLDLLKPNVSNAIEKIKRRKVKSIKIMNVNWFHWSPRSRHLFSLQTFLIRA